MEHDITAPTPFDDRLDVVHHFAGNLYAKEMHVKAGEVVAKHVHDYDHFSFLGNGTARVCTGDPGQGPKIKNTRLVKGPCLITIPANVYHQIVAVTAVDWYCIHATKGVKP